MCDSVNESEYRILTRCCDDLLQQPNATVERIAIPWLHINRPHPRLLSAYKSLFGSKKTLPLFEGFLRKCRNVASQYRVLMTAIEGMLHPPDPTVETLANVDILLVSHLLGRSGAGQEDDFYFSHIVEGFKQLNLNVLIVLINYTKTPSSKLNSCWEKNTTPRIVLNRTLTFKEEIGLQKRMRLEAKNIALQAHAEQDLFKRKVYKRAAIEACGGGALHAMRLGFQIQKLVSRFTPKAIMITYEGHSWERVVFSLARSVSPKISCIGYQHATVFFGQHAAFRPLENIYNPDVILTSGEDAKVDLLGRKELSNTLIDVVGSNRYMSLIEQHKRTPILSKKQTCVVLPEGDVEECRMLFEFSLKCALEMPELAFIWRLHPSMSFKTVIKIAPSLGKLPPNILLSKGDLKSDLAFADYAMYRGSTSIIQAVAYGAIPLYYERNGEMSIDPLYRFKMLRSSVSNVQNFTAAIAGRDFNNWRNKLAQESQKIYSPFNLLVLQNIMKKINIHPHT